MKNIFLILFFGFCILTSFAQSKINLDPLMEDYILAELSAHNKTNWSLYFKGNHKEDRPITTNEINLKLNAYLKDEPKINGRRGEIKEFQLVKKYRYLIDSMFNHVISFGGGTEPLYFIYDSPVRFGLHKDGKLTMMVNSGAISDTYKTINFTHRQRAAKVVSTYLFNILSKYTETINYDEIQYLGLSIVYGSSDPSTFFNIEPEIICLICELKKLKQFVNKELTEDELLNYCDVYAGSRDMNMSVKKIKLTLE